MSRTKIVWVVLAALLVAYPGMAWLIGFVVERQLQQREQQVLDQAPYLTLVKRDYQRRIYGASEELTYGLGGSMVQAARALPGAGDSLASMRLTIRNTIHHGPVPRLRSLALATVDSEVVLPQKLQEQLAKALGGKSIIEVHTRLGWFGSSTQTFSSPAFQLQLPADATLKWNGLKGTAWSSRGLASVKAAATSPGFEIATPRGGIELSGTIALTADVQRVFEVTYAGKADVKLQRLQVKAAQPSGTMAAQGIEVASDSSVNGDYLDAKATITGDKVDVAETHLSQVVYALGVRHLHGPSYVALTRALYAAQRDPAASSAARAQQKMNDALREHGIQLVLHEPVVEIPHVDFAMPEGTFHLSARLSAPGITAPELQGSAAIAALMRHLQASADVRVDTALAQKLLQRSPQGDTFTKQLDTFERQGYVKRDGAALATHLEFAAGKLRINGQPFPPAPPQASP